MYRSRFAVFVLPLACSACTDAPDGTTNSPAASSLSCSAPAIVATLPNAIREASGIAISASDSTLLWIHNDSDGAPTFFAVGTDGRIRAEIVMPGLPPQFDWEDAAAGPCPDGHCLYIGDIGDNLHQRDDRAILRLAEPDPITSEAAAVERFPISFPGGPEDAEAIFVTPDTSVFVITKGRRGPVTVYRYPAPFRAGQTVTLLEVQRLTDGLVQLPDLVTGAAATPDGKIVAIRTYSSLRFYAFDRGALTLLSDSSISLTPLAEPQGEGVALSASGTVFLVSESGPAAQRPTLSTMKCRLP